LLFAILQTLLTTIGETARGDKSWKRAFLKSDKKYFLHIQGESNTCPIWCPQYITRRGLDRDVLGDLGLNPGNIKEIFSTPVQTGTGADTASYTIGTEAVSQG
jgi:hypothetical protein